MSHYKMMIVDYEQFKTFCKDMGIPLSFTRELENGVTLKARINRWEGINASLVTRERWNKMKLVK